MTCAYTGADAIAAFEASRPDLVLLDLRLPDMTGFDVYARIREHSPVVIMISGHGDIPLAVQALQVARRTFSRSLSSCRISRWRPERAFEKVRLRQLNQYLSERRSGGVAAIVRAGQLASDARPLGAGGTARGERSHDRAAARRERIGKGRVAS